MSWIWHTVLNMDTHFFSCFSRHRAVWYVALAILVPRLLLVGFAVSLTGDDGDRYLQEGVNLVQYHVFSHYPLRAGHNIPGEAGYSLTGPTQAGNAEKGYSGHPQPTAHDLPGYPVILAGIMLLFKNLWVTARVAAVLNAIAFTFAAVELYGLLRLAGASRRVALWAMALFGLFPESFPYSVFHMPESFFLVAFLGCILLLIRYLREPAQATLLFAFMLLGVSILLKPISLFFAVPVLASICVRYREKSNNRARVAVAIVLGLLVEAAIVCPWILRNYRVFGVPSLTTVTGNNLFYINYPMMLADKGLSSEAIRSLQTAHIKTVEQQTPGFRTNAMVQSSALQKIVVSEIISDPLAYAKCVLKHAPRLYAGTGTFALLQLLGRMPDDIPMDDRSRLGMLRSLNWVLICVALSYALLLALYALAVRGLAVLLRQRQWSLLILACLPLFYFTVMYGPVTASSRYRLMMIPFLAILAGFGAAANSQGGIVEPAHTPLGDRSSDEDVVRC